MTRRLLAQLGLAAVALAATGGMALADSSPTSPAVAPGANQQQGGDSSANLDTSGNVTIQTSQTSSQQVGGSGPTVTPGSDSTPPTATTSDPSASASDSTDATTSTYSLSPGGSNGTPPSSSQPPSAGTPGSPNATTGSAGPTGPSAAVILTRALDRAAAVVAAAPYPTVVQARAASDIPSPPSPVPSHSPVGFLNQLNLMRALVVPPAQTLPGGLVAGTTLAAILITLGLAALRGIGLKLTPSIYTARLRQSGFLGAARSDVAAAHLSFATPLEMGCITRVYAT